MKNINRISIVLIIFASLLLSVAWPFALSLEKNEPIKTFFNSNATLTTIGTLLAAFAGAYGASFVQKRKDNIQELRNINAAIITAFSVTNSYIAFKKQHLKTMMEEYSSQKKIYESMIKNRKGNFEFQGNFKLLQENTVPIDVLKTQVFEKISAPARSMSLVITIHDITSSLNNIIIQRNNFINAIKASNQNLSDEQKAVYYFGGQITPDIEDNTYPDIMKGLSDLTDDCIYFSMLLGSDLNKHGQLLREEYGLSSFKIIKPDFSKSVALGLIPNEDNYRSWDDAFKEAP